MSRSVPAWKTWICSPRARAATCTSFNWEAAVESLGLRSTATTVALGTSSCSTSTSLGPRGFVKEGDAGDISSRSVEASNKSSLDRIGAVREDNWDLRRGRLGGESWIRSAACEDHRYLTVYEVPRQFR